MKRSNLTMVLSLVLVFGSGVAVGALGHSYFAKQVVRAKHDKPKTPEEYRKAYVEEMRSRLKLSDEQAKKLETILDDTRAKYNALRERQRPEMKLIQDGQIAEIEAMLSAAQKAEYAKMRAEREAKRKAEDEAKKKHHGSK